MKMMMPLLSSAAGHLHFRVSEASVLNPGDLIATLDLDDPEAVTKAEPYAGGFPELGPPQVYSSGVDHRFNRSLEDARMILAGLSFCVGTCVSVPVPVPVPVPVSAPVSVPHAPTSPLEYAGYEHPVDEVVADLMACLEDPALPLMQFTEAFAVVQVDLLAHFTHNGSPGSLFAWQAPSKPKQTQQHLWCASACRLPL